MKWLEFSDLRSYFPMSEWRKPAPPRPGPRKIYHLMDGKLAVNYCEAATKSEARAVFKSRFGGVIKKGLRVVEKPNA